MRPEVGDRNGLKNGCNLFCNIYLNKYLQKIMEKEILNFSSLEEGSRSLAAVILKMARVEIAKKHFFSLVLSGGNTPQLLYKLLAGYPFADQMPWQAVHLFWGDERFVPHDHADSNFAMANGAFLSHVEIPPDNVHPIPTNLQSPEASASSYERDIRGFFNDVQGTQQTNQPKVEIAPQFDLVLLGLGIDGHTASLFPDTEALNERRRWVTTAMPLETTSPNVPRITLTYPVINQARSVVFLVQGEDKRHIAEAIINDPKHTGHYPAARITADHKLSWYLCE